MNYLFVFIALALIIGCGQKQQVYQYTEDRTKAPQASVPFVDQDPHAGLDMSAAPMMPVSDTGTENKLAWNVPQGWIEEPGKGMRVATFHTADNPREIDVSIVSLGGMAGGLESNLKRWLGQISVQVPDEQLQKFIRSAKDNIFDLTQLQKGQPSAAKSMIAAMLNLGDATVFVKMTGTIEAVTRHENDFIALARSVRVK